MVDYTGTQLELDRLSYIDGYGACGPNLVETANTIGVYDCAWLRWTNVSNDQTVLVVSISNLISI